MSHQIEIADKIFSNAQKFKLSIHKLPRYDPVDELIKETAILFKDLIDEEDDYAISLKRNIWKLRASVVFSLVNFSNADLKLNNQINELSHLIEYIPPFKNRLEKIVEIIKFLIDNPVNPKRDKVFDIIQDEALSGNEVGLIINLTRGPTPGWSENTILEIKSIAPACRLISSPKLYHSSIFKKVILPAGGNLCPYLYSLYYGFRSERLDVVVYDREYVKRPYKKKLPEGSKCICESRHKDNEYLIPEKEESKENSAEEHAQIKFWEHIRKSILKCSTKEASGTNYEFFVESRLVLLANNKKVYLRDDMFVIEISDFIDRRLNIKDYGKRFPRRQVKKLEDGDLIVLRTSGSGEYLYEVADNLMEKDGRQNLRATALNWKPVLKQALQIHGSEYIADLLYKRGHKLSSHNYIWIWTTDYVIRPQSRELFSDLILILYELGFINRKSDPFTVASEKWEKMKDIIRYHITAGHVIRKALLTKLKNLIKKGINISDSYHLTLSGVGAGEMSVFRVAGIDTETIQIPYNYVNVITNIDG